MESLNLLCDEVWPMSPRDVLCNEEETPGLDGPTEQDCEESIRILLEKEDKYLTESGYMSFVLTDQLIGNARLKGVYWIVRSQRRMNLSVGTAFTAVNYLDRFISLPQCRGWKKCWMFELLSVVCLTVASKFNEITPPLREFQDGVESSFATSLIQSMELRLLKGLGWRMDSVTPFSYIHLLLLIGNENNKQKMEDLTNRVTQLLLRALLDPIFLEFRPCIAALAAVRCVFQDLSTSRPDASLAHWDAIIPQNHKDDLIKCQKSMWEKMLEQDQHDNELFCQSSWPGPTSPVTVLLKHAPPCNFGDCQDNVSIVPTRSGQKRKRGETYHP